MLHYHQNTGTYRIKFLPDGPEKYVRRFNLIFDGENHEFWKGQRNAATQARQAAKQRLRFDYFVSQQPMGEVRAIQGSTIRSIHEKVADGLPLDVSFPQTISKAGGLLRESTREVIQQHTRSIKKAIVFHKLNHSSIAREHYQRMGLPDLQEVPETPWSAKVSIPQYPFSERRRIMSNIHYSCVPEVRSWLETSYFGIFLSGLMPPMLILMHHTREFLDCK